MSSDFKFLHAADIHLDSPLRGLSRYEGVPADAVRSASRSAFLNLIEFAIDEKVAFVIIAGDLYDGDWPDFSTGLFFAASMGRLRAAGIRAFILYGNHDAASVVTKKLPWPDNVHVFSDRAAESVRIDFLGVALHGRSYRERETTENLALGYPGAISGLLNIGVLHTALTGREGHESYSPCSPAELAAKGYDYWALGHVHGHEVHQDPLLVFPGNLQGRNVREQGPKGAVLVSVSGGLIDELRHVALDVVRWAVLPIDCEPLTTRESIHAEIRAGLNRLIVDVAEGRPIVVRIVLSGRTTMAGALADEEALLREEVRAVANAANGEVWLEKIVNRTTELPHAKAVSANEGEGLEALLMETAAEESFGTELLQSLADFVARVPEGVSAPSESLLERVRHKETDVLLEGVVSGLRYRLTGGAS